MERNGIKITGASVSGVGTCLVVEPYKVVLDIGYCSPEARTCRTVLITHPHIDHMAGAVQHAAGRSLSSNEPSRFICPPGVAAQLDQMLKLWVAIQGDFKYEIIPLVPGQSFNLGKNLSVKAVPTFHRTESQGYVLFETRGKLKPEYEGLEGAAIGALRKQGVEVQDKVSTPVLAYTGDTMPEALEDPDIRQARAVITECSFVGDPVTVEGARKYGHTHLKELAPRLESLTCDLLVLAHFSLRHSKADIVSAMASLPEAIRCKLELLLDGDEAIQGWS